MAMDLSIVVPLYNEEDSVGPLYESVRSVVDELDLDVEMIFVDDGSTDQTATKASNIARGDQRLRVVKFRRNYGQTPAMAAGIDIARGGIIVTMDGDLQNDPRDIPKFLEKIDEGFDIVVGWRFNRQDKLVSRKIPSRIANWIIGRVTGVPIKDNGCSLKAYRANVIKQVPLYSEMHRFIPAMASIAGPRIAEIKVRHHARQYGESKYGLSRVYKVLLDLLTIKTIASFSARPLKWFAMLSSPFLLLSTFMLIWALAGLVTAGEMSLPIAGTAVLLGALGVFLLFSGGLAELVSSTGDFEVDRMPLLTAKEVRLAGRGNSVANSPDEKK
jgi:glycosyltransferase involved in cell wall biosynthesis